MEGSDKITLGYWRIRGLLRHVLLVAEYAKAPYEIKYYDEGEDFSGKEWFDVKFSLGLDFPNLPYLVHGGFNISETLVLCHYICEKYKPELLGEGPEERAAVMMLAHLAHQANRDSRGLCYNSILSII